MEDFIIVSEKFKYSKLYRELFQSNKELECVVARYNENTDWFKEEPFNHFDMICYNKGPKLPDNCFTETCKVINLDNVGRCDHTYLYHIVSNYNQLAPITIFLPGSTQLQYKKAVATKLIKYI